MELKENVIEWFTGDDRITVSLTQKKYINKVKTLAKAHVNEVDFVENEDGSIFAHLPLKSLKLSIISPNACALSNLQKAKGGRRNEKLHVLRSRNKGL